ncbi:MAG: hypothetical protein EAY65_03275 [Alphaproteobacteria bacterium]|nr:MAG: hypothetical protein EAY65_03275 [Alphaproteobacteria bacterium]
MSFLFVMGITESSHALFQFTSMVNVPPAARAYLKEIKRMTMDINYSIAKGPYQSAKTPGEDRELDDACFKGSAEQNPEAAKEDNLREESTIATEIEVIAGSQPTECMKSRETRKFSPLDLNPWYLTGVIDKEKERAYYQGRGYRTDRNPIKEAARLVAPSRTMQMGCAPQQMVSPVGGFTGENEGLDDPIWMRREMDNCTNQYILQHQRFIRDPDDAAGELFGVNTGMCQPLRLEKPPSMHELYEYLPSEYLGAAWSKLLVDETYLLRKDKAPKEPNYEKDSQVQIDKSIPIPAQQFGMIMVEDLLEKSESTGTDAVNLHFEKIVDPSHPYTPRWDFEVDDRSYSPDTVIYGGNPTNAVRCHSSVKVDLLSFRQHMFEAWVPKKINWNKKCFLDKSPKGCYNRIWRPLQCSGDQPCCSTRWDQKDKIPAPLNRVFCGVPMQEVCDYVARPLTPMNTLKMRKVSDEVFPEGAPEGYSFKEYFEDHKPYMRCWDTGTECGTDKQIFPQPLVNGGTHRFIYDPRGTEGSEFAIVGAGREKATCAIGGGKGEGGVAAVDPITSWSELKLYYTRGIRMGANCIGTFEKMFKPLTAEDLLLTQMGGTYQAKLKSHSGHEQIRSFRWPFGWRGYVSALESEDRFPNAGNGAQSAGTGLDDAKKGDIIVFDADVVMSGSEGTWRNPYLGYITNTLNERARARGGNADVMDPEYDSVKVFFYNHGRYVDACGMTDEAGMGSDATLFKTKLPEHYEKIFESDTLEHVTEGTTCDDPMMSACIEPLWGDIKRYRLESSESGE